MTAATYPTRTIRRTRWLLAGAALGLAAGCQQPLDFDLRGNFGEAMSTSEAAQQAVAPRPQPDNRGVISYPGYQVAVAERGDTVVEVANRTGTDPASLARYNGLQIGDRLRAGEVIALPNRVAEPSPATGALGTGPIQPPSQVDITTLAGDAIDRAQPTGVQSNELPQAQTGVEPVRHKVQRGETAYSIARLYNVSVRSLADWNGLGRDFAVREGQYLLIPVPDTSAPATATAAAAPAVATTTQPGTGSPTPTPPSASQPLPQDTTPAAAPAAAATPAPDLGTTQSGNANARMGYPVQGTIIRDYAKGKNDGIDIQASAGSAVKAASAGTVAAITSDADQVPIVVVKHPDNLLTVYANIEGIQVKKGDSVSRGQSIGKIRGGNANYVHFEVRKGFESVDPTPYLN
ncbi:Murein DD-endopeptidase MepM and murein hydrolase activator NlpD, contain LysM domain [Lutimaribacter pacificus]|uniref:Murein DD-endopeptidase MepM and murein hydrolase activator NlpD, contain LysM domain n=2 Tax=Lutimaribacter pacificus TaxID=391948 RepID=A0A1H0AUU5_9RHOB|nr:Murein DD-endopeptidase MepM and murein hydrolase activator NlpD, contain LysM domain [Lutimaribacter pacificus]SHJ64576.1 Murein DD-endopeptidase MepM and murein hydrolase activator NlpD, contain LysM domain [Lutimaribacter pacificus]